jgi:hypothetical protein
LAARPKIRLVHLARKAGHRHRRELVGAALVKSKHRGDLWVNCVTAGARQGRRPLRRWWIPAHALGGQADPVLDHVVNHGSRQPFEQRHACAQCRLEIDLAAHGTFQIAATCSLRPT